MDTPWISLGIFLVVQLVAAVWWASSMNTKMDFMLDSSKNTKGILDGHIQHDLATFSTKAEVGQALASHEKEVASALVVANKELAAMWKKVDALRA